VNRFIQLPANHSCRVLLQAERNKIAPAILCVREKQPYLFDVGLVNHILPAQGAFPLPGFFGQNMTAVGFGKGKFS
jgi:hypothetical protein